MKVQQQRGADSSANVQSGHQLKHQKATTQADVSTACIAAHSTGRPSSSMQSAQPGRHDQQYSYQSSTACASQLHQQRHAVMACHTQGRGKEACGGAEVPAESDAVAQPARQRHVQKGTGKCLQAACQDQSEADAAETAGADAAAACPTAAANEADDIASCSRTVLDCQLSEDTDTGTQPDTQAVRRSVFRPCVLKLDEEDNTQAGSAGSNDQVQPCTPLPLQGPLQQQPCTPGLETVQEEPCTSGLPEQPSASGLPEQPSTSGLPERPSVSGLPGKSSASRLEAVQESSADSCSTSGAKCDESGLVAENSIRFRKRSKFEALKARREEARLKAEVMPLSKPGHRSTVTKPQARPCNALVLLQIQNNVSAFCCQSRSSHDQWVTADGCTS